MSAATKAVESKSIHKSKLEQALARFHKILAATDFIKIGLKMHFNDNIVRELLKLIVNQMVNPSFVKNISETGKANVNDVEISSIYELFNHSTRYLDLMKSFPHLSECLEIFKENYKQIDDVSYISNNIKEWEKKGFSMLELLKFIDYKEINLNQLTKITEVIIESGVYLTYEEYSRFKYQYYSEITDDYLPQKIAQKYLGYFDCGISKHLYLDIFTTSN